MNECTVTTFYKFVSLSEDLLPTLEKQLLDESERLNLKGLILIGTEGINATLAGSPDAVETFKSRLLSQTEFQNLIFKDSKSDFQPFRLMKVQIRTEIVTLGNPEVLPTDETEKTHLSPQEWNHAIEEKKGILVDTRNWYETEVGTFKDAVTYPIEVFSDFADVAESQGLPKDQPIYMFCTGGIRCEKAVPELKRRGYKSVYQLEGGILNYLKESPNKYWKGECFVFDHRVAVDQNLQPSQVFALCPHCGQPAKDVIECQRCKTPAKVCDKCLETSPSHNTCSKNCAHHHSIGSKVRVKKQSQNRQRKLS